MVDSVIGRDVEISVLKEALNTDKGEMIAVVGRRRVGKTYLVEEVYKDRIVFEQTGIRGATMAEQLRTFSDKLELAGHQNTRPVESWLDAFFQLRLYLTEILREADEKKVVFFDELPWLAVPETKFLNFLGYFWNDFAERENLVVVLCGSASSWLINKVVNDPGGLHNRITRYLHLKPFTLAETEVFLMAKGIKFSRYETTRIYMCMGGIPRYLEDVKPGLSADQLIEKICFTNGGFLQKEFDRLYTSLFKNAHHHIAVIKALSASRQGLSRKQLIAASGIPNGGPGSRVLEELVQCDFIAAQPSFGNKKKGKLYRLIDEFSLFHLRFIDQAGAGASWARISESQAYKIWCGYAFENVCIKHILEIKQAMSIAGIASSTYSLYRKGNSERKGMQIDMLLERADKVINLFEIKFYSAKYAISKAEAERIREKSAHLTESMGRRYSVMIVYITPFGVVKNENSLGLVQHSLMLDDLFLEKPEVRAGGW